MKKLLALIIVVVFAGCSKEEFPENEVRSQAFIVNGSLGGEEFDLSPGTNGLFLYTDVDSNEEGNHLFSAHVASEDGNHSQGQLIFELHAWEEEGTSEEFLNSLELGEIGTGNEEFSSALLSYETDLDGLSIFEFTVNGESSTEEEGEIELPLAFDTEIIVQQELEGGACIRSGQYTYHSGFACNTNFESSTTRIVIEDDAVLIYPPLVDDDVQILWNFNGIEFVTLGNDELDATEFNEELFFNYSAVVLQNSEVMVSFNETVINLINTECELEAVEFEKQLLADPVFAITYISPEQEIFTSLFPCELFQIQPETSFVELLEIEEYEHNENGLPTKRITLNGNMLLFDEEFTGDFLSLEFQELSIAFPYQD